MALKFLVGQAVFKFKGQNSQNVVLVNNSRSIT